MNQAEFAAILNATQALAVGNKDESEMAAPTGESPELQVEAAVIDADRGEPSGWLHCLLKSLASYKNETLGSNLPGMQGKQASIPQTAGQTIRATMRQSRPPVWPASLRGKPVPNLTDSSVLLCISQCCECRFIRAVPSIWQDLKAAGAFCSIVRRGPLLFAGHLR